MKNSLLYFAALLIAIVVSSCSSNEKKYIIGVSQCSEDSWRMKLQEELVMATYFNEGVELRFTSAHDDSKLQEMQIDSLVNSGIDLLIVSPNQVENLSAAIEKVQKKGLPIVLYDRKIAPQNDEKSQNDMHFMGADNFMIGEMLAKYLVGKVSGKGTVVEIGGLKGSSPAQERHEGFSNVIKKYPDISVVAYQSGDWTEASGEIAMRRILREYDGPITAVYGGNDRMAIGARRVLKEEGRDNGNVIYLGVDALPSEKGGIQQVADSLLTASAIYPTRGDELLEYAINILNGKNVPKDVTMKTSIVTAENAKVLLLQHEEVVRQANYLRKMHKQAGNMHEAINNQRIVIIVILMLIVAIAIVLGLAIKGYQTKHLLNKQLKAKNDELQSSHKIISETNDKLSILNEQLRLNNEALMHEKEVAERQRDELEEQRDKIIEISMSHDLASESSEDEVLSGSEKQFRKENDFFRRFLTILEEKLSDPDLSVEDIGNDMCLSRAQLYRKVKALTGKSPVEIVREERLKLSNRLLSDSSLSISEIAYKVGFSSPSYFAKCYKDMYGKAPTDVQKK